MRTARHGAALAALLVALSPGTSRAGAVLKLGDDASLDLGFVLHTGLLATSDLSAGNATLEPAYRAVVRRARLRLNARVTRWFGVVMQTDRGEGDGSLGFDFRLTDAYAVVDLHRSARFLVGSHLSPSSRQNLMTSTAMLAIDRPGIAFKSLSWGTRANARFGTSTLSQTDAGLRTAVPVRDIGATFWGIASPADFVHIKYFASALDGVRVDDGKTPRLVGRLQLGLFDAEQGYTQPGTNLGKQRVVALGASVEHQPGVVRDQKGNVGDYGYRTADLFVELPAGPVTPAVELGYGALSLGGITAFDHDGNEATKPRDLRRAEGQGAYALVALLVASTQPWFMVERWVASAHEGSFVAARAGINQFIDGHHASVRLALERVITDAPMALSGETSLDSAMASVFLFYLSVRLCAQIHGHAAALSPGASPLPPRLAAGGTASSFKNDVNAK